MDEWTAVQEDWLYVLDMLPADLEESAYAMLALQRRREIRCAADLLRLALVYGLCGFSLRQTAAWATLQGIGELSDVAVLRRLQRASDWLGHLVLHWLQERGLAAAPTAWPVRIVDATVITQPGSRGTDWRLHLGLDLARLRIVSAEVTGPEEGETLARHTVAPGELVLADRGYAHREGLAHVREQGGHVLVRLNWQNCPLETRQGQPLDIVACLATLAPGDIGDWPVQFRVGERTYAARLVALPKTRAAADRERRRIRQAAKRKGRRPDARSRRAAGFVYVLTDLPADVLPAAQALELYRLRWQIEIAFKRLKSLLHLDRLRAKQAQLARTYLYAQLLGALILDELRCSGPAFSPWGYPLWPAARQSLALAATVP